jgi:hypothetical protein
MRTHYFRIIIEDVEEAATKTQASSVFFGGNAGITIGKPRPVVDYSYDIIDRAGRKFIKLSYRRPAMRMYRGAVHLVRCEGPNDNGSFRIVESFDSRQKFLEQIDKKIAAWHARIAEDQAILQELVAERELAVA